MDPKIFLLVLLVIQGLSLVSSYGLGFTVGYGRGIGYGGYGGYFGRGHPYGYGRLRIASSSGRRKRDTTGDLEVTFGDSAMTARFPVMTYVGCVQLEGDQTFEEARQEMSKEVGRDVPKTEAFVVMSNEGENFLCREEEKTKKTKTRR